MNKKADIIFKGEEAKQALDDEFYQSLGKDEDPGDYEFGFDDYDVSVEIYKCPNGYRLSQKTINVFKEWGFLIIYVNHLDGWESHYSTIADNPSPWRVRYARNSPNNCIEVERFPKSWPKEWLKTGYVKEL